MHKRLEQQKKGEKEKPLSETELQDYDDEYGEEIEEKIKEIKDQGVKIITAKKQNEKKKKEKEAAKKAEKGKGKSKRLNST